jgi:hypothetical protein
MKKGQPGHSTPGTSRPVEVCRGLSRLTLKGVAYYASTGLTACRLGRKTLRFRRVEQLTPAEPVPEPQPEPSDFLGDRA